MATKRKFVTGLVAGAISAALLLGGTFAWTSISQSAKNESTGIVNVGGRLHDDFGYATTDVNTDGRSVNVSSNNLNKDVYVENFTDPLNGGQPIYARIKLTEYMEVGSEAGQATDPDRKATPVVEGTKIDEPDNWPVHIPNTEATEPCPICITGGTHTIHDHWEWTMGGQTIFMPTFNRDKDSLAADINGTYAGIDDTDKVYYDDHVVYTTDNTAGGVGVAEADKETHDGPIYSIVGTEYYDDDTDTEDNGGTRQVAGVTHTAKQTATAEVMTMAEWQAAGNLPGNYWVYDVDGWAYWANPIMPGEATGLLLDGIRMISNPGEKCYYAINVVGQFATVGDWTQFGVDETDEDYPSDEALALLTTVSQSVPTVEITGESYVTAGDLYTFTATASRDGLSAAAEGGFEWAVADENGNALDASAYTLTETAEGAELTLEAGKVPHDTTLYVTARSTDETHLGATGVKAIVVKNADALVPEVEVTVNGSEITNIREITLTADVMHNLAAYEGAPIVWSIEDESGNAVPETVATVAGDKLTIVQTEGEVTLVVRATCTLSGNTTTATVPVSVNTSQFCDTCGEKYTDNGFCPTGTCTTGQYEPALLSEGTYQVANGGQLFWFAEQVNESGAAYNATLTGDIDLENKAWTPIGSEKNYNGTFDGNGKRITNLSITASGGNDGLFGRLGTATVKDFSVSGELTVHGVTADSAGYATIGAVYGNATISGIHSAMNITVEDNNNNKVGYVAGILGYLDSTGSNVTIENCSYTGTITGAAGPTYDCIGGIVGYVFADKPATINNCLFAGEINVVTSTATGGIIGYYRGGKMTITNCLSYGVIYKQVSGDETLKQTGAIAGMLRKYHANSTDTNTVSNCYYCYKSGSSEGLDAYGEDNTPSAQDRVDNGIDSAPVTETEITDGTVCGKLNNGGTVWTQPEGAAYPVPNGLANG